MNHSKFILKDKKVIVCNDIYEWGRFMEHKDRIVKQEIIGNSRISTVFLGLDHRFGEGEPLVFETMIFGGKEDQYQNRCSTWEQAEKMHLKALKKLKGGKENDTRKI